MDAGLVIHLARQEARRALRHRWLLVEAGTFALLSLGFSYLSLASSGLQGLAGFGRTSAGLINLVLLMVPLMALTTGAGRLAGARETGSLAYLLAQPVSRGQVLAGTYLGQAVALTSALGLSFGLTGLILAWQGGTAAAARYGHLVGLTLLLALAMLSVGLFISAAGRRAGAALAAGLAFWFGLVFLADLGLMGTAVVMRLPLRLLLALALLNPLQVFKLAAIGAIQASLDVLGPAGLYATELYGAWLQPLLVGNLLLWLVLPLAGARLLLARSDE